MGLPKSAAPLAAGLLAAAAAFHSTRAPAPEGEFPSARAASRLAERQTALRAPLPEEETALYASVLREERLRLGLPAEEERGSPGPSPVLRAALPVVGAVLREPSLPPGELARRVDRAEGAFAQLRSMETFVAAMTGPLSEPAERGAAAAAAQFDSRIHSPAAPAPALARDLAPAQGGGPPAREPRRARREASAGEEARLWQAASIAGAGRDASSKAHALATALLGGSLLLLGWLLALLHRRPRPRPVKVMVAAVRG